MSTVYEKTRYPGIRRRTNDDGTTTYAIQVRLRGFPAVYETKPTLTKAVSRREEIKRELREGRHRQQTGERTVGELIERYKKSPAWTDLGKATQLNRSARLKWWTKQLGQHTFLRNVTPEIIAKLRDDIATGNTVSRKPGSPATVNRYLATLSAVYKWAAQDLRSWVQYNPVRGIYRPREPRGKERILTDAEWKLLDKQLAKVDERLRLMVLCSLSSSVRQGELLTWDWSRIRLEDELARIESPRKGGPPRIAHVSGLGLDALRRAGKDRHASGKVFADKNGKTNFPRNRWEALRTKAGLDGFRWHDLRHTAITWMASLGASESELMLFSGHLTPEMAARYTHLGQAIRSEVAPLFVRRLLRVA